MVDAGEIRSLITEKRDAATIKKVAVSQGMDSLFDDGFKKVLEGYTTLEEVLRAIKVELI